MNSNKDKFLYTYSALSEQDKAEIKRIRADYQPDDRAEKFARLRRLNARVRSAAMATACVFGAAGCLLFGGGMSLTLVGGNWVGGIILSACGVVPMLLANPVYNRVLHHCRKKYGPEILRLSEELLAEQERGSDTELRDDQSAK